MVFLFVLWCNKYLVKMEKVGLKGYVIFFVNNVLLLFFNINYCDLSCVLINY